MFLKELKTNQMFHQPDNTQNSELPQEEGSSQTRQTLTEA